MPTSVIRRQRRYGSDPGAGTSGLQRGSSTCVIVMQKRLQGSHRERRAGERLQPDGARRQDDLRSRVFLPFEGTGKRTALMHGRPQPDGNMATRRRDGVVGCWRLAVSRGRAGQLVSWSAGQPVSWPLSQPVSRSVMEHRRPRLRVRPGERAQRISRHMIQSREMLPQRRGFSARDRRSGRCGWLRLPCAIRPCAS